MPGTVTVACKIPQGIVLQVYDMDTVSVPVMGGGFREMKLARQLPWRQKINGPARKIGQDLPHQVAHGYALTHNVDADHFAKWLEQYKDTELVKNGLVFAQGKANDAIAQANEHKKQITGFEPIDPKNLPPEFRKKIETAVAT